MSLRTHFEVLGLEVYKSSKMSCPRLEDSTFFDLLKIGNGHELLFTLPWKTVEASRKICEDLFLVFWKTPDFLRKISFSSLAKTFFFFGGRPCLFFENTCALCPRSLALASKISALASREFFLEKWVLGLGLGFFCVLCPECYVLDSTFGILLQKLQHFGVRKVALKWFTN